jgi:hypothetical protein
MNWVETAIAVLGTVAPIVATIAGVVYWLGGKFAKIDAKFEDLYKRFNELREQINVGLLRLATALTSYQEFFTEYLAVKGVSSSGATVKGEARRFVNLALANPLTREEWEKLKRYLDKDPEEFAPEEAYEFRDLARKAALEYGDRPEAYKLHLYACIVAGLAAKKTRGKPENSPPAGAHPRTPHRSSRENARKHGQA